MKRQLFTAAILVLTSLASATVNPVAYYPFDGNANDESGNGNHGIAHNVDLTEGKFGEAYSFRGTGNWGGTGSSSFIEIDGSGSYNTYTVSLWVKVDPSVTARQIFSDAHGAGAHSHGRPDIGIRLGKFFIIGGGSGAGKAISKLSGYNDDQWHHVVGTVNANTDTVQLYVNGEFQSEVSTVPAYPLILDNGGSSDYRVDIGARSRKGKYFKGAIDEVSIFNKVLSAEEVQQLFDKASVPYPVIVDIKPGGCPNPVNVKSKGVLPVAILGAADFDVATIDPASIELAGVRPIRSSIEDVAGPAAETSDCNCGEDGPDGIDDLTLKFKTQEIVGGLGEVNTGDVRTLTLTGVTQDGTPIEGADCVTIVGHHNPFKAEDVNRDGVVSMMDLMIIANAEAGGEPCHYRPRYDLDGNCQVNVGDLALLSLDWLVDCEANPTSPECIPLDIDGDGFDVSVDCNDNDPNIYPGATEICNDGLDNDCDGLVDGDDIVDCSSPPGIVIINELRFNDPGSDGEEVFIELWGPPSISLDGFSLVGVNGANGQDYVTINLTGNAIDASGYFLIVTSIADPSLESLADMTTDDADLQNGPDSLRLQFGAITVDMVGYGSGAPVYEGSPAIIPSDVSSLSRCSHSDTDDNLLDFQASTPSPKSDGTCE